MVTLPEIVKDFPKIRWSNRGEEPLKDYLERGNFRLWHRGKIRDTYLGFGYLLVVASDRISVLDFVLPTLIPSKGEILTAITHFWLTQVLENIPNHLNLRAWRELFGPGINFPPAARCLTVDQYPILPFELIFRAHLGGSVWKSYQEAGAVAGQPLPAGLKKWDKLAEPIFTPSTKAEEGHDVNITVSEYEQATGVSGMEAARRAQRAYQQAYEYARARGILILDTKLEMSESGIICDEVFTPDSSRFTTVPDWEQAQSAGRDPIFFDKEPVRVWARGVLTPWGTGYQNLDPENPEHVAFVHSVPVPLELVQQTADRYHKLFQMLVGQDLADYQKAVMGIN